MRVFGTRYGDAESLARAGLHVRRLARQCAAHVPPSGFTDTTVYRPSGPRSISTSVLERELLSRPRSGSTFVSSFTVTSASLWPGFTAAAATWTRWPAVRREVDVSGRENIR